MSPQSLPVNNVHDCDCLSLVMLCLWTFEQICMLYLHELYLDLVKLICMYSSDTEESSISASQRFVDTNQQCNRTFHPNSK